MSAQAVFLPFFFFLFSKTLHTLLEMGSAALVAAVPYPGRVTQISHKGQGSNKGNKERKDYGLSK